MSRPEAGETYYVGVYWGHRQETSAACARRAAGLMRSLQVCDPLFVRWTDTGDADRALPPRELQIGEATLQSMFEQGRARRDTDAEIMPEAGFTQMVLAAGADGTSARLTMRCGAFGVPRLANSCAMRLPSVGSAASRLLRVPVLVQILRSMVQAWQPDWGVVNTNVYRDSGAPREWGRPIVGWLTYLPVSPDHIPPLPAPSWTEPCGSDGSIVGVTRERFTASNASHAEAAARVAGLLRASDLLGPTA